MLDVYRFGLGDASNHAGTQSCFCFCLTGHVVRTSDSMLLKAYIDDEAQMHCSQAQGPRLEMAPTSTVGGKIILRACFQDYEVVLRHVREMKVIRDSLTVFPVALRPRGRAPCRSLSSFQGGLLVGLEPLPHSVTVVCPSMSPAFWSAILPAGRVSMPWFLTFARPIHFTT